MNVPALLPPAGSESEAERAASEKRYRAWLASVAPVTAFATPPAKMQSEKPGDYTDE